MFFVRLFPDLLFFRKFLIPFGGLAQRSREVIRCCFIRELLESRQAYPRATDELLPSSDYLADKVLAIAELDIVLVASLGVLYLHVLLHVRLLRLLRLLRFLRLLRALGDLASPDPHCLSDFVFASKQPLLLRPD